MSLKSIVRGVVVALSAVLGLNAWADLTTNFVRESETTNLPFGWTSKQYNGSNTPHFKLNGNGAVLNYAWKQNAIQTAYSIPSTEEVTIDVVTHSSNADCDNVLFLASTDYSVAIGNSYNSNKEITIGSFEGDASSVFVTFQNNTGTNPGNKVIVAEAGEINVAGSLTYHLVLNGTSLTGTVTDSNSVTKEIAFTLPAEYTFTAFGLALDGSNNQVGVKSVSITGGAPISDTITFVGEDGGAWDVAENWSKGAVPTAEDDVLIDAAKSIVLTTSSVAKSVAVTANATFTGAIDGTKIKGVKIDDAAQLTVDVTSGVTSEIRNVSGGTIVKTGAGDLHFSNDSGSAINGTTIKITEGRAGPFNGNQDAVMTNPTFVIGENGGLENKGWLTVNGTLTLESDFDKSVLSNDFGGNRNMAKIGGGTAIVKKGTGTITLCSGSNANYSTLTVEGGKLNFGASVPTVFNGAATAEGVVGVTNSTLQFNGAATLNGGLEVAENRAVTFNSSNAHVVKGISGPGTITMSGSGNLYLAKNDAFDYSLGGGATVNINAATLGFGRSGDIDGSKIGNCTLVFNGGNASAYGWITASGTIVADVQSESAKMDGNANNRTQDAGKLVKTGSGTLQWNSHLDIAVSVEAGLLDAKTNTGFGGGNGVVTLAGETATFAVKAKLADDKVVSGVEGKTVSFDEGSLTYSLAGTETIVFKLPAIEHAKPQYRYEGVATWTDAPAAVDGYHAIQIEKSRKFYFQYVSVDETQWTISGNQSGYVYSNGLAEDKTYDNPKTDLKVDPVAPDVSQEDLDQSVGFVSAKVYSLMNGATSASALTLMGVTYTITGAPTLEELATSEAKTTFVGVGGPQVITLPVVEGVTTSAFYKVEATTAK